MIKIESLKPEDVGRKITYVDSLDGHIEKGTLTHWSVNFIWVIYEGKEKEEACHWEDCSFEGEALPVFKKIDRRNIDWNRMYQDVQAYRAKHGK